MAKSYEPRVYVVDDEAITARTLATILNQNGFAAVPFTDPAEAMRSAKETPPDLLISDVSMSQMSGVELAIEMQETCQDCKILLFSGHDSNNELLADARKRGYEFELLQKPLDPKDLVAQLRLKHSEGRGSSEPSDSQTPKE